MTAADTVKDLHHVAVKRCPACGARFGIDAAFCPFDGIALAAGSWDPTRDPLASALVDGRYEVLEPLGEGGMGTVYRVRHLSLDRLFAMKVLRRDLAADAELAARFVQEARATAAVKHPGVVSISDFGELDDGTPYFVMELLDGETLASRLRGRGPLSPSESIMVARKIAEALGASHAAGVIHRDLKPENVFLIGKATGRTEIDDIRLVDFGAAKVIGGSKLTRPGVVFGTPYYMSPEQASGLPVDARADIYSLGVLLYEMLTGSVPFEADTYMGVLTKHMFAAPVRPSERVPLGVSLGALEEVVLRALDKDPAARYASMAELGHALTRAAGARTSGPPKARVTQPVAFAQTTTADRIQRSVTRQFADEARRRRRLAVVAVVSASAAMVGLVLFFSFLIRPRLERDPPPSAAVEPPRSPAPPRSVAPRPLEVPAPALAPPPPEPPEALAEPQAPPPPPKPAARLRPAEAPPKVTAPPPPPRTAPPPTAAPPRTPRTDDFVDPWSK
jgi:eukaryotic-like serine/threonine-protein kinase